MLLALFDGFAEAESISPSDSRNNASDLATHHLGKIDHLSTYNKRRRVITDPTEHMHARNIKTKETQQKICSGI